MTTDQLSYVNSLTLKDAALWYAAHGWRVFPCQPGQKVPLPGCMWQDEATDEPWTVGAWWDRVPDANIGLVCGDSRNILDLDQGEGKDGWRSYLALGGDRNPPWPQQETPSGGKHLLFLSREPLRNFTRRGPHGGMDMRTDGGYVLGAPSVVGGVPYRWIDGDPAAPIPEKLMAAMLEWSRRRGEIDEEPPMQGEPMSAEDVARWVGLLEMRDGEGTGDQSRDAFNKMRQAFTMGMSLGQAATVLPESWIGWFGSQEPHGASNPLRWAWRYVVLRAWADGGQKEPQPVGAGAFHSEEELHESTVTVPDLYDLLKGRIEQLSDGDGTGYRRMLEEVTTSGLDFSVQKMLWQELKRYTGFGIGISREGAKEIQKRKQPSRSAESVESAECPVYVADQGKILMPADGVLLTKEAFLTIRARDHGGSRDEADQVWLAGNAARAQVVSQLAYDPGLPHGCVEDYRGVRVWNTYRPSGVMPRGDGSAESVKPWLDLLRALRLEDGQPGEGWLLDRLAAVVQHPGRKINHGLLLGGQPGIGKDSFLAPWLEAVGRENVKTISGDSLASDFNSWVARAKVVIVNEIDYGDHRDRDWIREKMKPVFAAPPATLEVNEKNLRPYSVRNLVFGACMTNHRTAVSVDQGERRYLALWCEAETPEGSAVERWSGWFRSYWGWLAEGGHGRVLAYLQRRVVDMAEIEGQRPPVTAWLGDLMEGSADPLLHWLRDHTEAKVGVLGLDSLSTEQLQQWVATGAGENWGVGTARVDNRRLSRALHGAGWRRSRAYTYGGRRWLRPGVSAGTWTGGDGLRERIEARKILVFPGAHADRILGRADVGERGEGDTGDDAFPWL